MQCCTDLVYKLLQQGFALIVGRHKAASAYSKLPVHTSVLYCVTHESVCVALVKTVHSVTCACVSMHWPQGGYTNVDSARHL